MTRPRIAVALGGGAARGLAHIGVLEVLEREGLRPAFVAGTSMGGLVGAAWASGAEAGEIRRMAATFRFPRWFFPGATIEWRRVFPAAAEALSGRTFADLPVPLALVAVDLEEGSQVILADGSVLDAVQATCAVPGVLSPVRRHGRWLVDGAVMNALPVDVAGLGEPDAVVAVSIGGRRARPMPRLATAMTALLTRLGRAFPNPATARMAFDVLVRASEIALDRTTSLTVAMAEPEVFIEVDVADLGFRDFHRLDDAVAAGRRAAEAAIPALTRIVAGPPRDRARALTIHVDPVCGMVVAPARARAPAERDGVTWHFCSENCRVAFDRDPGRYTAGTMGSRGGRAANRATPRGRA